MDPIVGAVIIMLSVGVALVSLLIGVVSWLRYRRTPWRWGAVAAVCGAVVLGCGMAMPPGYHAGERERVQRLHAQFAPALERYRQTHGAYPPTLEAAGIATPRTEYGPLQYTAWRTREGAPAYSVSFGDYYRNGFTAYYDSRQGEWQLDS